MNNIDFFFDVNKQISIFAEEVCVLNGKIEENLFDVENVPVEYKARFMDELMREFGLTVELDRWLQFSFQAADQITYDENKLMLVYSGGEQVAKEMQAPVEKAHTGYCINYYLDSKKTSVKFYDLAIEKHAMPELPEGSQFASPFGHGVSVGEPRKDIYFIHHNIFEVAEFYNLPAPVVPELKYLDSDMSIPKVFGLAYHSETMTPIKLKRYFYPRDPLLKHTVFDE